MLILLRKGFTLIELLVVISIIATLSVIVLIVINPIEMYTRTKDAGRISTITQLARALENYAATHNGMYVPQTGAGCDPENWIGCLINAGEVSIIPDRIRYNNITRPCYHSIVNVTWCYDSGLNGIGPIIAYVRLESKQMTSKCTTSGTYPFFVYSSSHGRSGVVCTPPGDDDQPDRIDTFTFID